MKRRHFPLTPAGYNAARKWLQSIGEWDKISTSGFSTDGFSITESANALWSERKNKKRK
jgi:hypothetical protein